MASRKWYWAKWGAASWRPLDESSSSALCAAFPVRGFLASRGSRSREASVVVAGVRCVADFARGIVWAVGDPERTRPITMDPSKPPPSQTPRTKERASDVEPKTTSKEPIQRGTVEAETASAILCVADNNWNEAWAHVQAALAADRVFVPAIIIKRMVIRFLPTVCPVGSQLELEGCNKLIKETTYVNPCLEWLSSTRWPEHALPVVWCCLAIIRDLKKDYKEAVRLYRLAAEKGNPVALTNLGYCVQHGNGIVTDDIEAVRLYNLAKEKGHIVAIRNLGDCYFKGVGVALDVAKAAQLFRLSSFEGNPQASSSLARCYEKGIGVPQDQHEAAKLFRFAAEQGVTSAISHLDSFYERCSGITKDLSDSAMRYFKLAVARGDIDAEYHLGRCYDFGCGVFQDTQEAARLYRLSADKGHPKAQYLLACCYEEGDGVAQDDLEAVRLYTLAAQQGNCDAVYSLGVCHEKGIGVVQNPKEAARLYRQAANNKNEYAQYRLGLLYRRGEGVPKDDMEAVQLFQLSAEKGLVVSIFLLATCLADGTGTPRDVRRAVRLFRRAERRGQREALSHLEKFEAT